jgi:hypothetical protein
VTTHAQSDDFDIAKGIFDQLKELPAERQQRVLRWIAEGLGVPIGGPQPPVPPATGIVTPPPAVPIPGGAGGGGPSDIKSFVAAKSPKSDQQFATTVAYFYQFEAPPAQKRDSVTGEILQEAARLAGHKRLTNPRVTLNNAKAAGYLDSSSRGEFTINSVGENLVAMTLPGGAETPAPRKRRVGRKPKAKSTAKKR